MTESDWIGRRSALAADVVLQDRYRIVRLLGKGGMGAVYEAVDQRLDTRVALKETFSSQERLRRQFEQEARLLAHLDHPALPRVTDYFAEADRIFLVMHYISGPDLAEIISNQPGPFPQQQVIAWADQLLDALVYLHTRDRQIIHRDIKPHNLKLTSSGQVVLLDFGLAKTQSGDASTTASADSIFGYTRRYSPLEQIQDRGTTPRSDIYALGATLYHLLTGIKPPDALARASALVNSKSDELRPAHELNPAVGSELAAILSRAMALNPENRYASAHDFREELRKLGRDSIRDGRAQVHVSSLGAKTVNTTVVGKARFLAIDPFDSYSILKPAETAWLIPKPNRRPVLVVAILFILLAGGVAAFYDFGRLIDTGVAIDYARTETSSAAKSSISQSKSDKPRNNVSDAAVLPGTPTEAARKPEAQRRRDKHGDGARASSNNSR